jgi:hypothetical protein
MEAMVLLCSIFIGSASFSEFAEDAEPMPAIFVIVAGASKVEQNSAETGLS